MLSVNISKGPFCPSSLNTTNYRTVIVPHKSGLFSVFSQAKVSSPVIDENLNAEAEGIAFDWVKGRRFMFIDRYN